MIIKKCSCCKHDIVSFASCIEEPLCIKCYEKKKLITKTIPNIFIGIMFISLIIYLIVKQ